MQKNICCRRKMIRINVREISKYGAVHEVSFDIPNRSFVNDEDDPKSGFNQNMVT
jgi:hypothetical protein